LTSTSGVLSANCRLISIERSGFSISFPGRIWGEIQLVK
jgi:hypothetical protein